MEIRRGIGVSAGYAIGEALVFDREEFRISRRTIATTEIDGPSAQQLNFVDATSLTFGVPGAPYALKVDHLDYVPFRPAPEPPNSASF